MGEATGPVTSDVLAEILRTNPVVIRRIMAGLRDAGFVRSEKGHGGGWTIARDLKSVTLRHVFDALGAPDLFAMRNRTEAPGCLVEQAVNSVLDSVYQDAESLLLDRFGATTLAELSADFHARILAGGKTSMWRPFMQHDAIVIGGSYAGLSAAIHIARARRAVCVIDTGSPRNRFSNASHGFFGQDGAEPLDMIAGAMTQLRRYPTVRLAERQAIGASAVTGGFEVSLASGATLTAAKLVLAFGISDVLPTLRGLAERWGKSVLHCPYCHGLQYADVPPAFFRRCRYRRIRRCSSPPGARRPSI